MSKPLTKLEIVRGLKVIREKRWSKPERLSEVALLNLSHIESAARQPKEAKQLAEALREDLKATLKQIKRREGKEKDPPRSVAYASGALLHLEPPFEDMPIEEVRKLAAKKWLKDDGSEPVRVGHYRQNIEPFVLETFADAFIDRMHAREKRQKKNVRGGKKKNVKMEVAVGEQLRDMETATYEKRLQSISKDGSLEIRDEDEMLEVLLRITKLATKEFKAVDNTPAGQWFEGRLGKYLAQQLARVKKNPPITLERIYLVSEDKHEDSFAENVAKLIKCHEAVSAKLLLCPFSAAKDLECAFEEGRGLFLADGDGEPLAVTGKLGAGKVGDAYVYTRDGVPLQKLRKEYERLREDIALKEHDTTMRKQLGLA